MHTHMGGADDTGALYSGNKSTGTLRNRKERKHDVCGGAHRLLAVHYKIFLETWVEWREYYFERWAA